MRIGTSSPGKSMPRSLRVKHREPTQAELGAHARQEMIRSLPFQFSTFKLCQCRCDCPQAHNVIDIIDAPEDQRVIETIRPKLWAYGMDYLIRPGAARGYLTALDPPTLPLDWQALSIKAFNEGELAYYRRKNGKR